VDDTSASPLWGDRVTLKQVTQFADAVNPELSPDGKWVAFVRREANGTRFSLSVAPVPEGATPVEDPKDLFQLPDSLKFGGVLSPAPRGS